MPATEADICALYEQYGHVLYHRCWRIMGNEEDAHDAVQETFAKVMKSWESFRDEASPLTWMYRISTNLCLNQIRNRRGREDKRTVHRQAIVGDGYTEPDTGRWENSHVIRHLLGEVDEQTRQVVIHLYFDDMTREEAAKMVGVSVPTLRKRHNAFLKKARRILETAPLPVALGLAWLALFSRMVLP